MAKGDANFGAAGKKGYMGGKYSRKAMNLSKKELGKAGVAAARKRTVDISQTRRESGKTLGPGGKPLTGRVKMGNGNIAVYKDGKRVISQAPKKAAAPSTTRKPTAPATTTKKAKDTKTAPANKRQDKVKTSAARDRAMAGRPRGSSTSSSRTMSNVTPSNYTGMSTNRPGSTFRQQRGVADDVRRALSNISVSGTPGDRYNKEKKRWETYKNGKWVPGRKSS